MNTPVAILGTTPQLSALELDRLGWLQQWSGGQLAEITAQADIEQLGGVIKFATTVAEIPRSLEGIEVLFDLLSAEAAKLEAGKLRFGFSVYAADAGVTPAVAKHYAKKLKRTGITWKKQLKQAFPDISIRYVESQEPSLSSVIVHKEKLLPTESDFIIAVYKKKIVLARTNQVQDYKQFSQRDYGRPQRDHKSGMLPPKVARMMVNVAAPRPSELLVDPFCGSGTVLQEALLTGHTQVAGSDLSQKAVDDANENLQWLAHMSEKDGLEFPHINVQLGDVRNIAELYRANSVSCVVAEGYLGPTRPKKTDKVHRQMQKLYMEAFEALPAVLKPGARVVLAVPAWQRYDRLQTLDIEPKLAQLGFTPFHEPVLYGRAHAKVVRQILCVQYR